MDFIQSGKAVNADVINNILCLYNLHVTDEVLNALINMPFFLCLKICTRIYTKILLL